MVVPALCAVSQVSAFVLRPTTVGSASVVMPTTSCISQPTTTKMAMLPEPEFSSLVIADQSWRQYVSLGVIAIVLIDIVLGSPLANTVLKPLKAEIEAEEAQEKSKNTRERIDSEAVAREALDKAQGAVELRRYLEESKTDWDRMEELKKKLDAEMVGLDADLKRRQASIDSRQQN